MFSRSSSLSFAHSPAWLRRAAKPGALDVAAEVLLDCNPVSRTTSRGGDAVPRHLAIIMDGNRRWARAYGLPTLAGHERGYATLKRVRDWCLERSIRFLTVFAFSTENWQRAKSEVAYLLKLTVAALTKDLDEFDRKGLRLLVIGRRTGLPRALLHAIENAEARTARNRRGTLVTCFNYGGQSEIVDAVRAIMRAKLPASRVTETAVERHLYAPDIPSPDLIIRTSGEQRLSGFLTWQSAYSELYFTPTLWPAFSERTLDAALAWYAARQRRFGQ